MAKTSSGKSSGAKAKVTGLRAKSATSFVAGKDPKKAITGIKAKGAGVDLPSPKGDKPKLKAKSVSKMG